MTHYVIYNQEYTKTLDLSVIEVDTDELDFCEYEFKYNINKIIFYLKYKYGKQFFKNKKFINQFKQFKIIQLDNTYESSYIRQSELNLDEFIDIIKHHLLKEKLHEL